MAELNPSSIEAKMKMIADVVSLAIAILTIDKKNASSTGMPTSVQANANLVIVKLLLHMLNS